MILTRVTAEANASGLFVMGANHPNDAEEIGGTLILLGTGAGFWPIFTASPEYKNAVANPVDTWSKRVIGSIAAAVGATASYPSDGPPYAPFIAWALATGRFFQSPTGMMVHDTAGLMISIRGALHVAEDFPLAATETANPCLSCADQPCTTACPVGALSADAPYDVPACKAFLETSPGRDCMDHGCKVRRACPVSQGFGRPTAQSAFHMTAFKG